MGEPKQLLQFENKSLLRRAAETAIAVCPNETTVVLGANAKLLASEIADLPVRIVVNENWASGMSESIKTGLTALLAENQNLDAAIVMLADQPLITPEILNRLIETFHETNNRIIASFYNETTGVPALFGRRLFDELLDLQGDAGARAVIEKNAASVRRVAVPEAAFDVDTPADYQRVLNENHI